MGLEHFYGDRRGAEEFGRVANENRGVEGWFK